MTNPWDMTTPDGLPPELERAWEAMRARCREADEAERTLRVLEKMIVAGVAMVYFADIRLYDYPTLAAAVSAWAKANPEDDE